MDDSINDLSISKSQDKISKMDAEYIDVLYSRVQSHIDHARLNVQKSINVEMVNAFWLIGREIVEEEQKGKERTEYGQAVLQTLSNKLTQKYGRGFSVDNLERARKLYLTYPNGSTQDISATPSRKSTEAPNFHHNLSWSHYVQLIRVTRPEARAFYALEASKNNWSARELYVAAKFNFLIRGLGNRNAQPSL